MKNLNTTQFSIYKIDDEKTIDTLKLGKKDATAQNMLEVLLESIEKQLSEKRNCEGFCRLKYKGFQGIVFKTIHEPEWKKTIQLMLKHNKSKSENSIPEGFLYNANISYVLFHICNDCIYVMTGGYGSYYINQFVERNYGLYLLPKILKKNNPVVKNIKENNLTGNRTSTHRTNRSNTSFLSEQDLSSIYKELNVEIDRDIAAAIGIEFDESESIKKKINLVNKDSLVIRRSMSLDDLLNVLTKLNTLENKPDNFVLNYLVLAKKKGINKSDLINQLIEEFARGDYRTFILVGEDYERYVLDADNYRIVKEDGNIFLESKTPITLDDIFKEVADQGLQLSKAMITRLLRKWQIETRDRQGNSELYPNTIINVIQGFIEFGEEKRPCYLINGDWYVFDEVYKQLLDKEYHELYKLKLDLSSQLKKSYQLDKPAKNENAYNKSLNSEKNIIVSHTALYQNVEIADAIFWDTTTLYLMHNKGKFDGIGARDLVNQMLTAAECLQNNRMISGSTFMSEYYKAICKRHKKQEMSQASEDEFISIFNNKKICFIAGYLEGYKKNSQSTYAKYLTIEANKKLSDRGYDFIPMGISLKI